MHPQGNNSAHEESQQKTTHGPCVQQLKLATLNVRGLHSHQVDVQSILTQAEPDVIILTETKLRMRRKMQWLHRLFTNYNTTRTNHPQASKAGVLVAISNTLLDLGKLIQADTPTELAGHLTHIVLERPQSQTLHIMGVYCPHQLPIRKQIYKYITGVCADIKDQEAQLLIAGDMNATI